MSAPSANNETGKRNDGGAFGVTLAIIIASVSAAGPFQFVFFWHMFQSHGAPIAVAVPGALVITCLVEGATWHGAVYYFNTSNSALGWVYRIETMLFAIVAATANFSHGYLDYNWIVGLSFAMASLMGVGAWELHMLRTKQINTGFSVAEMRLWHQRNRHYPKVMDAARKYRAVYGVSLDWEKAWQVAYVDQHGTPKLPVPMTDEVATRLLGRDSGNQRLPSGGSEDGSVEVVDGSAEPAEGTSLEGDAPVLELGVDWTDRERFDDIIKHAWPAIAGSNDTPNDNDKTAADGGSQSGSPDADRAPLPEADAAPNRASNEGAHSGTRTGNQAGNDAAIDQGLPSENGQNDDAAQRQSTAGGNRQSARQSGRQSGRQSARQSARQSDGETTRTQSASNRQSQRQSEGGSGVRIPPTKSELDATRGAGSERVRQYLNRVCAKHSLDDLDLSYVREKFGLKERQFRNAVNKFKTGDTTSK